MKILVVSLPNLKKILPQRPPLPSTLHIKKHNATVLSVNAWGLEERKQFVLCGYRKRYYNQNIKTKNIRENPPHTKTREKVLPYS